MEIVANAGVLHCMARVVAACTSTHNVCLEGEHVNELALPFITPLRAEHDRGHQASVIA